MDQSNSTISFQSVPVNQIHAKTVEHAVRLQMGKISSVFAYHGIQENFVKVKRTLKYLHYHIILHTQVWINTKLKAVPWHVIRTKRKQHLLLRNFIITLGLMTHFRTYDKFSFHDRKQTLPYKAMHERRKMHRFVFWIPLVVWPVTVLLHMQPTIYRREMRR